uniref:hypothetical protein n=1 Tax=Ningiella ruwaisensis TaxID=2364274 RepID=UPI001445BF5F|nr:hypothetical protein [Ningiella ruwaisensis]
MNNLSQDNFKQYYKPERFRQIALSAKKIKDRETRRRIEEKREQLALEKELKL